jgi:hypothetical protein
MPTPATLPFRPELPPVHADPIGDYETDILNAGHPDEALILAATAALRKARAALLALADASDEQVCEAGFAWARAMLDPAAELKHFAEVHAESEADPWTVYETAADRAYDAAIAREMAS